MNHFDSAKSKIPRSGKYRSFSVDELPLYFRLQTLRLYGKNTLSYATAVQSGLCHFANRDGYLAYQKKYGHTFVLGDPVASNDSLREIIDAFLDQHRNVTFCQIGEDVASILNERKYWVNELGVDSRLDLANYDFSGKEKERFRYAANWLARRNFEVCELELTQKVVSQVRELTESWMKTRTIRKETAFLNRPLEQGFDPDGRRFFLRDPNGMIQAFVFFDPIYENDEVIGHVTTFKRRHPDAPSVAEQGICKLAIEQFKREGKQTVRLGLSPFAEVADDRFRYNWLLKKVFRYYFNAGWVNRYFFNLQGHAEFKRRFRGESEKTYFASPSWINDVRLFAMMRLCKLI
jgi:phosphatidylglycerol lysyltransferase